MAICYHDASKTFSIHTCKTTYQMQVGRMGHLLHLYYGSRLDEDCLDYRFVLTDCGFSPNSYEARYRRDISLDVLGQEYPGSNSGDFRTPALECRTESGVLGTDLRYVRHDIRSGKYKLNGLPAAQAEKGEAETLSVTLRDETAGIEVELLFGVYEKEDVICRAAVIHNVGNEDVWLERASSACLEIPFERFDVIHFHGRHCMERIPERTPLIHGISRISSRRGASSHHQNPFIILAAPQCTEEAGACIGIMPVYSGNHCTDIEVDQAEQVRVVSGINPEQFVWKLSPGKSFITPEVLFYRSQTGLSELSNTFHRFLRNHMIRSIWKERPRPVLINSWEAMMFDFNSERLLRFAEKSMQLGFEMMVLDDGWFGKRDSDNAGLGDWKANEEKLPGGLLPLTQKIHAMGMKFGLWIEPEMVNEDSDLYREHPDWALMVPGRRPAMGRNQLVLDMGRTDVVEYLGDVLTKLIRDNEIDYIKWDMNRNISDVFSHILPPDQQMETSHRYILGVYELMERLTGTFPQVLFEGCAGGGGRFDAGMLYYMPQIWCSDDTDAIERLTIQRGTSFGYPVSTMGAHVSACPNQQTGRYVPLGTRAIVAMNGTFGYELDPETLSEEDRHMVMDQIHRYHRFEDLICRGSYFRLSEFGRQENYDAWQYVNEDRSQTLVCLVVTHTGANTHGIHLRLRGLCPEKRYRIQEAYFEGCKHVPENLFLDEAAMKSRVISGAALMHAGYTVAPLTGDYPSLQLFISEAGTEEGN